jgi:hypothetical protein
MSECAWAPKSLPSRIRRANGIICLDRYIRYRVYQECGICVRNHCGTEPPCDIESPGLVTTVGWRDRASTSYAATDRVKAPENVARGRFRRIHGGRTAPSLSPETRTTSGGGCLADSVPQVLVRSHRCSRTPPRPLGTFTARQANNTANEKEDKERDDAGQAANRDKGEMK